MARFKAATFIIFLLLCKPESSFACSSSGFLADILCRAGAITADQAKQLDKAHIDIGKAIEKSAAEVGKSISLFPVREFLTPEDMPPKGFGAYGVIAFHAKPTDASRAKLMMVCKSFVAHFPKNVLAPSSVALKDRMVTVWPVDQANPALDRDDCDYALDHYSLSAAQLAMQDASLQKATFEGQGPYLIGWSPSESRGISDKLVLVIDLTKDNTQSEIDTNFLFWKSQIVENPELWRNGFSLERLRVAIMQFSNEYGKTMIETVKLLGGR